MQIDKLYAKNINTMTTVLAPFPIKKRMRGSRLPAYNPGVFVITGIRTGPTVRQSEIATSDKKSEVS